MNDPNYPRGTVEVPVEAPDALPPSPSSLGGTGRYLLVRGDARTIPLLNESVHCVVCSPPYWSLRDYGTGQWEGGDPECNHQPPRDTLKRFYAATSTLVGSTTRQERCGSIRGFRDTCARCGARRVDRQIGLEPVADCRLNPVGWTGPCGQCYVCHLVAVFREVRRVLREDGTCWIVIGDSYANNGGGGLTASNGLGKEDRHKSKLGPQPVKSLPLGLKSKDLCLIPFRVAAALQSDKWYVRSIIPWVKRNSLPESTNDRPNVAHEYVIMLSKSEKYYFDMEAVRRPMADGSAARYARGGFGGEKSLTLREAGYRYHPVGEMVATEAGRHWRTADLTRESLDALIADARADIADAEARLSHLASWVAHAEAVRRDGGMLANLDGEPLALLINPEATPEKHYAVYPTRLVDPIIRCSTSEYGCCAACGSPWRRVVERSRATYAATDDPTPETGRRGLNRVRPGPAARYVLVIPQVELANRLKEAAAGREAEMRERFGYEQWRHWTRTDSGGRIPTFEDAEQLRDLLGVEIPFHGKPGGWQPTCRCGPSAGIAPAVVLDIFSGLGTTCLVARTLGRHAIGLDLSAGYLADAARRIARGGGRPREAPAAGQLSLFD